MTKRIEAITVCAFVSAIALVTSQANAVTLPPLPHPIETSGKKGTTSGPWIDWNNVRVNVRGGVRLLDSSGNPVHAKKFQVYATDLDWEYAWQGVGYTVTTPNGQGGSAVPGYNFPGKPVEGIILYQGTVTAPTATCALTGTATSVGGATPCNGFSNTADIMVSVNDGTYLPTDNTGHDDNGGAFDLHLKIVP